MSAKKSIPAESIIRDIKRKTRRKFPSEEKIRIVLERLRGEESLRISVEEKASTRPCATSGARHSFEAGKKQLPRGPVREIGSEEVGEIQTENEALKALVAELNFKNRVLEKSLEGFGVRITRFMKYSQSEKMEIIRMVEDSKLSVRQTLREIGLNQSNFYDWYKRYQETGYDDLASRHQLRIQFWNAIPEWEKQRVVKVARK